MQAKSGRPELTFALDASNTWPKYSDDFTCTGAHYYKPRVTVTCSRSRFPNDRDFGVFGYHRYIIRFSPAGLSYTDIGTAWWARKLLVEVKDAPPGFNFDVAEPHWEGTLLNNWGKNLVVTFDAITGTGEERLRWVDNRILWAATKALCVSDSTLYFGEEAVCQVRQWDN